MSLDIVPPKQSYVHCQLRINDIYWTFDGPVTMFGEWFIAVTKDAYAYSHVYNLTINYIRFD